MYRCPKCKGEGEVDDKHCYHCHGTGKIFPLKKKLKTCPQCLEAGEVLDISGRTDDYELVTRIGCFGCGMYWTVVLKEEGSLK